MKDFIDTMKNKMKYGEIRQMKDTNDYLHFETMKDAYEWGEENYKKWADWYNEKMSQLAKCRVDTPNSICTIDYAVPFYCGYGYKKVNQYLRYLHDEEPDKTLSSIVNWISLAIITAPRIPDNIVVYRRISGDAFSTLLDLHDKHGFMTEKGFMSTSLTLNGGDSGEEYYNENNILKIYVDKGMRGMYVYDIETCHRSESEVLFMHGMDLQMVKYPYYDDSLKKTIMECKMIDFRGWD